MSVSRPPNDLRVCDIRSVVGKVVDSWQRRCSGGFAEPLSRGDSGGSAAQETLKGYEMITVENSAFLRGVFGVPNAGESVLLAIHVQVTLTELNLRFGDAAKKVLAVEGDAAATRAAGDKLAVVLRELRNVPTWTTGQWGQRTPYIFK